MTDRTLNLPQRPASKGAADITGTARVRPVTKLRTIDETADLFNTSTRTVRRLVDSGALPVLGIPTIATTHSDGSRPPVPNDRDQQCGAGADGAVG